MGHRQGRRGADKRTDVVTASQRTVTSQQSFVMCRVVGANDALLGWQRGGGSLLLLFMISCICLASFTWMRVADRHNAAFDPIVLFPIFTDANHAILNLSV